MAVGMHLRISLHLVRAPICHHAQIPALSGCETQAALASMASHPIAASVPAPRYLMGWSAFSAILCALPILVAGYRSIPPHKPSFISGGTVAGAARHRAFFHRCLFRNCKSGWCNVGNGRAALAASPPDGSPKETGAIHSSGDGMGLKAANRGQIALGVGAPDCSAARDVPVAYRLVRVVKSRRFLAFASPFAASRDRSFQKYIPSPIA